MYLSKMDYIKLLMKRSHHKLWHIPYASNGYAELWHVPQKRQRQPSPCQQNLNLIRIMYNAPCKKLKKQQMVLNYTYLKPLVRNHQQELVNQYYCSHPMAPCAGKFENLSQQIQHCFPSNYTMTPDERTYAACCMPPKLQRQSVARKPKCLLIPDQTIKQHLVQQQQRLPVVYRPKWLLERDRKIKQQLAQHKKLEQEQELADTNKKHKYIKKGRNHLKKQPKKTSMKAPNTHLTHNQVPTVSNNFKRKGSLIEAEKFLMKILKSLYKIPNHGVGRSKNMITLHRNKRKSHKSMPKISHAFKVPISSDFGSALSSAKATRKLALKHKRKHLSKNQNQSYTNFQAKLPEHKPKKSNSKIKSNVGQVLKKLKRNTSDAKIDGRTQDGNIHRLHREKKFNSKLKLNVGKALRKLKQKTLDTKIDGKTQDGIIHRLQRENLDYVPDNLEQYMPPSFDMFAPLKYIVTPIRTSNESLADKSIEEIISLRKTLSTLDQNEQDPMQLSSEKKRKLEKKLKHKMHRMHSSKYDDDSDDDDIAYTNLKSFTYYIKDSKPDVKVMKRHGSKMNLSYLKSSDSLGYVGASEPHSSSVDTVSLDSLVMYDEGNEFRDTLSIIEEPKDKVMLEEISEEKLADVKFFPTIRRKSIKLISIESKLRMKNKKAAMKRKLKNPEGEESKLDNKDVEASDKDVEHEESKDGQSTNKVAKEQTHDELKSKSNKYLSTFKPSARGTSYARTIATHHPHVHHSFNSHPTRSSLTSILSKRSVISLKLVEKEMEIVEKTLQENEKLETNQIEKTRALLEQEIKALSLLEPLREQSFQRPPRDFLAEMRAKKWEKPSVPLKPRKRIKFRTRMENIQITPRFCLTHDHKSSDHMDCRNWFRPLQEPVNVTIRRYTGLKMGEQLDQLLHKHRAKSLATTQVNEQLNEAKKNCFECAMCESIYARHREKDTPLIKEMKAKLLKMKQLDYYRRMCQQHKQASRCGHLWSEQTNSDCKNPCL